MAKVILTEEECEQGVLPSFCMKCGRPAEVAPAKQFSWHPQWVILLILVGQLIYVIVALVLTKRRRVWTPLCPDHAGYWTIRTWFTYGGLLCCLGSLFGLIFVAAGQRGPSPDWVGTSFIVLGAVFLAWLFAVAILHGVSIRPEKITPTRIGLLGVHPDFVAALERQRDAEYECEPRHGEDWPRQGGHFKDD